MSESHDLPYYYDPEYRTERREQLQVIDSLLRRIEGLETEVARLKSSQLLADIGQAELDYDCAYGRWEDAPWDLGANLELQKTHTAMTAAKKAYRELQQQREKQYGSP